jgi:hypothetical protein
MVINTHYIHKIHISPHKYQIQIVGGDYLSGSSWSMGLFGLGTISTHLENIHVCETTQPINYNIVSEWLRRLDDDDGNTTK